MLKKIMIIASAAVLILSLAATAAPGDSDDPIVVLSYLDKRLDDLLSENDLAEVSSLKAEIDELKRQVSMLSGGQSPAASEFEVVEIRDGQQLIANAGTEIILRGGEAYVVSSELGGLTNVTMAKDFVGGMVIPSNNLLIVPRSDGRGVCADEYAIMMVRGTYEIRNQ